ncbi:MAG: ABC transporter permease [Thermosphaera sp.]
MLEVARNVLRVVEWDLMKLRRQKAFIAMRTAWFVIQSLVFGYAISRLARPDIGVDYYNFYLLGLYSALLYSASIARAYVIADEFDDGIIDYHLSLPVKRSILAIGRVLGGSISTLAFTIPMMMFILLLIGRIDLPSLLISVASAFAFSTGVVSFVVLVVMKLKSTDTTDIFFGTIDAILVRLSSIFYPLPIIKAIGIEAYYYSALMNPLTHFADFLRALLIPGYTLTQFSPVESLFYVLGLSLGLLVVAIELFEKKLEAGGVK